MKRYINPQMDLLILDAQDIVCASSGNQDPEQSIGVKLSGDSNGIQNWRLGGVINN